MNKQIERAMTVQYAWEQLPHVLSALATGVKEAGNIVAFLLDHDPQAREKFRKLHISPSFYGRLERVGRGSLLPELVNDTTYARLPVDQQRLIIQGETVAVVQKADGSFDTMKVDLMRADPVTVFQVIAPDHIRTPAEQRIMIERKHTISVTKSTTPAAKMPWRVAGKTIVIKASPTDLVLTRNDLLTALRLLED